MMDAAQFCQHRYGMGANGSKEGAHKTSPRRKNSSPRVRFPCGVEFRELYVGLMTEKDLAERTADRAAGLLGGHSEYIGVPERLYDTYIKCLVEAKMSWTYVYERIERKEIYVAEIRRVLELIKCSSSAS